MVLEGSESLSSKYSSPSTIFICKIQKFYSITSITEMLFPSHFQKKPSEIVAKCHFLYQHCSFCPLQIKCLFQAGLWIKQITVAHQLPYNLYWNTFQAYLDYKYISISTTEVRRLWNLLTTTRLQSRMKSFIFSNPFTECNITVAGIFSFKYQANPNWW